MLCIDTAHGHSQNVIDALRATKRECPEIDVVAGSVATSEGAKALIRGRRRRAAGRDGPGFDLHDADGRRRRRAADYGDHGFVAVAEPRNVPVIADGGIRFSGDITKALAAGASAS